MLAPSVPDGQSPPLSNSRTGGKSMSPPDARAAPVLANWVILRARAPIRTPDDPVDSNGMPAIWPAMCPTPADAGLWPGCDQPAISVPIFCRVSNHRPGRLSVENVWLYGLLPLRILYAADTIPEQSYPLGPADAQMYGLPAWFCTNARACTARCTLLSDPETGPPMPVIQPIAEPRNFLAEPIRKFLIMQTPGIWLSSASNGLRMVAPGLVSAPQMSFVQPTSPPSLNA